MQGCGVVGDDVCDWVCRVCVLDVCSTVGMECVVGRVGVVWYYEGGCGMSVSACVRVRVCVGG